MDVFEFVLIDFVSSKSIRSDNESTGELSKSSNSNQQSPETAFEYFLFKQVLSYYNSTLNSTWNKGPGFHINSPGTSEQI